MDMSFRLYDFSTSVAVFDTFASLSIYDRENSVNSQLMTFFLDDEKEARILELAFYEIARHRAPAELKSDDSDRPEDVTLDIKANQMREEMEAGKKLLSRPETTQPALSVVPGGCC